MATFVHGRVCPESSLTSQLLGSSNTSSQGSSVSGCIKKVVVKNTACEASTLQQAIDLLCFLIPEREEEKCLPSSKEPRKIRGCSGLRVSTPNKSSVCRGRGPDVSVANAAAALPSWLVVTGAPGQPPKPPASWGSESESRSVVSHPTDCSLPGASVRGVLQARVLEWVAVPCSKHAGGSCQSFICICGCPGSEIISLGNCHMFQILCWDSGTLPTSPTNRRQAVPSWCGCVVGREEDGTVYIRDSTPQWDEGFSPGETHPWEHPPGALRHTTYLVSLSLNNRSEEWASPLHFLDAASKAWSG